MAAVASTPATARRHTELPLRGNQREPAGQCPLAAIAAEPSLDLIPRMPATNFGCGLSKESDIGQDQPVDSDSYSGRCPEFWG